MQFKILEQNDEKKSIKIGIKDADATIINPIIEKLSVDENVKIARYIETHPELDMPALYVEMKEGKGEPKDAIIAAAKDLSDYFSEIKEQ